MATVRIDRCHYCQAMVGEGMLYEHLLKNHPAAACSSCTPPRPSRSRKLLPILEQERRHMAETKEPFSNGLTAAQAERLALLAEECGEVVQAVTKVLRHGYESYNPTSASISPSNREALAAELGHVMHAMDLLTFAQDVSRIEIVGATKDKALRIAKWLHHQRESSHV